MGLKDDQIIADKIWTELPQDVEILKNQRDYMLQKLNQLKNNSYYNLEFGVDQSATYGETDKQWIDDLITALESIQMPAKIIN